MKYILALLFALVANVVAQSECQACTDGVGTATNLALGGGDIVTLICGNATLQNELQQCVACPAAGADSLQSVDQQAASEYISACSSGVTGGVSLSSVSFPSSSGIASSASSSGASSTAASSSTGSLKTSAISSVNFGSASATPSSSSSSSPPLLGAGFQAVVSVAMLSVVAISSAVYLLA